MCLNTTIENRVLENDDKIKDLMNIECFRWRLKEKCLFCLYFRYNIYILQDDHEDAVDYLIDVLQQNMCII